VPTDSPSIEPSLLDDLEWRGLVAHSTDLDALREALTAGSVRFYVGFDPTAPSLHMGNLVQIVTAMRLQRAGHTPYVLFGGATCMIGDPKDSGERVLTRRDGHWTGAGPARSSRSCRSRATTPPRWSTTWTDREPRRSTSCDIGSTSR
jgi:tyrosyl-tRNA synthetase